MSAAQEIAVQPWSAPAIGAAGAPRSARRPQDFHGGERRVWQEAETAGRAAGLEAARIDVETRTDELLRKVRVSTLSCTAGTADLMPSSRRS